MEKERLISLTKAIYRLALFFPKKEPLRYKIKEKACDILAKPDVEDFEVLDGFFAVAKEQNWVKAEDILVLQKEYDSLKSQLIAEKEQIEPGVDHNDPVFTEELKEHPQIIWPEFKPRNSRFCERHDRILSFLKESGRAQVWQLKQILPDVSKRTLRRDFEFLVNEGVIERIGERNSTYYQIKLSQLE